MRVLQMLLKINLQFHFSSRTKGLTKPTIAHILRGVKRADHCESEPRDILVDWGTHYSRAMDMEPWRWPSVSCCASTLLEP